jgi:hypothetical protein
VMVFPFSFVEQKGLKSQNKQNKTKNLLKRGY